MNILGIDTSTRICEISLKIDSNSKIFINRIDEGYVHSERLIPGIRALLSEAKITIHDINFIALNIGPGSFTGIRVGMSCARSFSQILDIDIIPIISMDLVQYEVGKIYNDFDFSIVLLDALRNEAFTGVYTSQNEIIEDYSIYNEVKLFKLLELEHMQDKKILVSGSGVKNFYDLFKKFDNIQIVHLASIEDLRFSLIEKAMENKINAKKYFEVKPFYLRETAAEEKSCSK